jgi:hypothetical protein
MRWDIMMEERGAALVDELRRLFNEEDQRDLMIE